MDGGIVTRLEPAKRRGARCVKVFLDGRYAFSLQRELAEQLRMGEAVPELRAAQLLVADDRARAMEAALVFLSYRPRSEREVRERLRQKQIAEPVVEAVLERLKEQRLVDDEEFARYWVNQRQTHRPRGSALIRRELYAKGIAGEISSQVLESATEVEAEVESAYKAARRKAEGLRLLDRLQRQQKLGQFLLRRGFDYHSVRSACRRIEEELAGS